LRGFARERLAGFKGPAQWAFLDEMPRNAIGKILHRKLDAEPQAGSAASTSG
jgi:acyl-coenzyme A synthetase/AMP-(fatty) acid ligase